MQLFYIPKVSGNEIVFDEEESKHAVRVLRMLEGDIVQVTDGNGGLYDAEIIDANPKKCYLRIVNSRKEYGKRNFGLHIAIAPTKNIERFEWFLEKSTEIGIDEITPLLTEHSERKHVNLDRLQKIIVSAVKQSVKAYIPRINQPVFFKDFINATLTAQKFIAHCHDVKKEHLKEMNIKGMNSVILIGPEGDFSENEVESAKKMGFIEISLGISRLRTETAGIAACHIVNLANE